MNQSITPLELADKIQKAHDFLFLDVREEWEYEEKNIGAQLMPLHSIPCQIGTLMDWKNKEIIVHCKSGTRSRQAQILLQQHGFDQVITLKGGIEAYLKEISFISQ